MRDMKNIGHISPPLDCREAALAASRVKLHSRTASKKLYLITDEGCEKHRP
jgi:hypothetical protein